MYRSGLLRTVVQTISKEKIPPSSQVLSSKVSTKNETPNQSDWSQEKKHAKQKFQRHLHTSGKCHYNCNTPMTYEPWIDEDIICVLQGSCMPGSTRYCRTNSMFGKLDMADIMQGVPGARKFSTLAGNPRFSPEVRRYHATNNDGTQSSLLAQKFKNPLLMSKTYCSVAATVFQDQPEIATFCQTNNIFRTVNTTTTSDPFITTQHRLYSTSAIRNAMEASEGASDVPKQLSQREKLKRAVKDYGGTVVVFHVCISLASLGGFYLAVSSGLDVAAMLKGVGFSEEVIAARLATKTSTFVIAYAVYKLFMPVRLGITLTVAPLLVQYLRRFNVLKPPMK